MTTEEDFLRKRRLAALIGTPTQKTPPFKADDVPKVSPEPEPLIASMDTPQTVPAPASEQPDAGPSVAPPSGRVSETLAKVSGLVSTAERWGAGIAASGAEKSRRIAEDAKQRAAALKSMRKRVGPIQPQTADEASATSEVETELAVSSERARPGRSLVIAGSCVLIAVGVLAFVVMRAPGEPEIATSQVQPEITTPSPQFLPAPEIPLPIAPQRIELPPEPVAIEHPPVEPVASPAPAAPEPTPLKVERVAVAPLSTPRPRTAAPVQSRPAAKPAPKPIEKPDAWQEKAIDDIAEFERQLGG